MTTTDHSADDGAAEDRAAVDRAADSRTAAGHGATGRERPSVGEAGVGAAGVEAMGAVVGERLRALRAEQGLSLSALAARAEVGKGSLSEIEHGARNPTLATLYALAGALGVPLATLLAERVGAEVASEGVHARLLDAHRLPDGTAVEVYHLHLDAEAYRVAPGHGDGVVEHLVVTSGRVRAGRQGEEGESGPGETLRWTSDRPHTYRALGGAVDAVLVIRSP